MTTATAIKYKCPDWCERTDHDADVVDASTPPFHYGPTFGPFWLQAAGDQPFEIVVDTFQEDERSIAGMRQVALHALAVAEWLEARA